MATHFHPSSEVKKNKEKEHPTCGPEGSLLCEIGTSSLGMYLEQFLLKYTRINAQMIS